MMSFDRAVLHSRCFDIDSEHSVCMVKPACIRRRDFATQADYEEAMKSLPPERFEPEGRA